MDSIDKQLLNIIQTDFPIDPRPYRILAKQLELSELEVLDRVESLTEAGIIRKIGPVFETRKLGYTSTLVAAKVPADRLEEVAAIISELPAVTHNYGRDSEYNLWFTMTCAGAIEATYLLEEIKMMTGISNMYQLPAERVFKIKVDFEL